MDQTGFGQRTLLVLICLGPQIYALDHEQWLFLEDRKHVNNIASTSRSVVYKMIIHVQGQTI